MASVLPITTVYAPSPFLTDPASALKVKILFWYVLPASVTVSLFSVMGYSLYRYTRIGKEKHPANLVSPRVAGVWTATHVQEDRHGGASWAEWLKVKELN